jgi:hypothetical protein
MPVLYCIVIATSCGGNWREYPDARSLFIDWYAAGNIPETLDIALAMQSASRGRDFTIALNDCGIIPFYSGFRTIDLAGLNNRRIALAGMSKDAKQKAAISEIREQHPHLIMLITSEKHDRNALYGAENLSDKDVTELGYRYIGMMKEKRRMRSGRGYHLLVYANDDPEIRKFTDELAEIGVLKFPPARTMGTDEPLSTDSSQSFNRLKSHSGTAPMTTMM